MHIKLIPQRRDDALVVSRAGDVLTINGEEFDFSPLLDGATLPAEAIGCDWIVGPVERLEGKLQLVLLLPHGASPTPDQAFPLDIVDPPDGEIALPQNVVNGPEV